MNTLENRYLKTDKITSIAQIFFSVHLILYIITIFSILQIQVFPTIKRVTYGDLVVAWSLTENVHLDILTSNLLLAVSIIISLKRKISIPFLLILIAVPILGFFEIAGAEPLSKILFVASLPIFLGILVVEREISHQKLFVNRLFLNGNFLKKIFIILSLLEIIVIIRWIFVIFFPFDQSDHSFIINNLELNLFYAFANIVPYFVLFILLSFIIKPYFIQLVKKYKKNFNIKYWESEEFTNHILKNNFLLNFKNNVIWKNHSTLQMVLLFAVIPSIILPFYSYIIAIEPNAILSRDIPGYVQWMNYLDLAFLDQEILLYQLFVGSYPIEGDRPLTLLIMYGLTIIVGTPIEALRYLPLVLGPMTVFASFFLIKNAYPKSEKLIVIGCIMTALSHYIIVGFYSGFFANWLAIIFMLLATAFVIRIISNGSNKKDFLFFAGLSCLVLFLHSYTFSYFIATLFLFLTITLILKIKHKESLKSVIILTIIIFSIIGIDVFKSVYFETVGGFQKDLEFAESKLALNEFKKRWFNLDTTFKVYLGGFLSNPILYALVLVWMFTAKIGSPSDRFFLSSIYIAIIPFLFGDYVVQSRIFFNIPFQIVASIIIYKIFCHSKIIFFKPLGIFLILFQAGYALRSMANMEYTPLSIEEL